MHQFTAVIEEGRNGGALVAVPFSVEDEFGTRGRVKVRATFDGHPYRGSIAPMGGRHILGVRKDVRAAIGKGVGDDVEVTIAEDTEPRMVEVPSELARTLDQAPDVRAMFEALSYTHRREFAQWVDGAKKQDTRDRRAAKAVEMIRSGERR